MARIFLSIESESPQELLDVLGALADGAELPPETEVVVQKEVAPVGESQKRKPGRPAKAAAEQTAAADPAASGASESKPSERAPSTSDPFAEQIKRSALTAGDVKAAGAEFMKTHSVAESMELIKKIAGVEAFTQVPEDKYEELYVALKAG